jgi:hypothetical protein
LCHRRHEIAEKSSKIVPLGAPSFQSVTKTRALVPVGDQLNHYDRWYLGMNLIRRCFLDACEASFA